MTPEELKEAREFAERLRFSFNNVSADTITRLCDEVERLQNRVAMLEKAILPPPLVGMK